ncbi:unnamed protein product, partial [Amoebophrya sp. A120]
EKLKSYPASATRQPQDAPLREQLHKEFGVAQMNNSSETASDQVWGSCSKKSASCSADHLQVRKTKTSTTSSHVAT